MSNRATALVLLLSAFALGACGVKARPFEEGHVILQDDPMPGTGGLVSGKSGEITIYRKK